MFGKIFGAIGIIGKIIKWILLAVFLGLGILLLAKLFDGDFFRLFEPDKSNLYDVLQS